MRLVDALIKADKRFDLLIIPGARHGFGSASGYFSHMRWEFFAEHLLDDHQRGADILTIRPFNEALGIPEELGRRIARNTQIIAMEESQLGRVAYPTGGAWFTESFADDLAEAAWKEFQTIEAEGGYAETLVSGAFQKRIADVREARAKDIAKRKVPITGVSEFPLLDEITAPIADMPKVTPKDGVSAEGFAHFVKVDLPADEADGGGGLQRRTNGGRQSTAPQTPCRASVLPKSMKPCAMQRALHPSGRPSSLPRSARLPSTMRARISRATSSPLVALRRRSRLCRRNPRLKRPPRSRPPAARLPASAAPMRAMRTKPSRPPRR